MRLLWLLFISCALTSTTLSAQGLITGTLLDEAGNPAAFANVLLLQAADSSLTKGSITGENGQFTFEQIKAGRYLVSASSVGYDPVFSEAFDFNGKTLELPEMAFGQAGVELDAVTVEATKPFMELRNDKLIINVESSPVAAGSNALELLAKAPGVVIDQDNRLSLKGKSGVLVMIDGKNTYMSTEELIRMLETTPADNIETIEIIDNPSAKYDAQGNAGIINIRMKKDKNLGLNGNFTAGAGYGNFPKANSSLRLNYREKDFNVYGNYSYYYNKRFQNLYIDRRVPTSNGTVRFDQANEQENWSNSHRASVGFDYFISDKTTIGILGNTQQGSWKATADNITQLSGNNPEPFSLVNADMTADDAWDNYTGNVNVRHTFDKKGQEISFDADYARYVQNQDMTNSNYFFDAEKTEVATPNLVMSDNTSKVTIRAVKADYSHPITEKIQLETGAKFSAVRTDNGIDFSVFQDDAWVNDPLRTNQFRYEESILAGYINLNTQWKIFNIQMGLRGEQTASDGYSVTLDQRVKRDYFNLFPSMAVSHQVGEKHSLSYTYSRRIDRPSYQDLNPFVFFLDQYTFGVGNPFLQPQLTNSFGMTYSLQNTFMLNVNYARTTDVMQEVILQNDEELSTFQTWQNLDNFDNFSVSASVPVGITKWWSSRVNLVGFYNKFDSEFSNGAINEEQWSARFNVNNNFTLPSGIRAELSGWYQSAVIWGIFQIDPRWSLDAGVSTPVLNGKGNLKLNIVDIFNTNQTFGFIDQGTIDMDLENLRESRRVNLSFSYRFGNDEVKPARNRRTATEEEQGRVKN